MFESKIAYSQRIAHKHHLLCYIKDITDKKNKQILISLLEWWDAAKETIDEILVMI